MEKKVIIINEDALKSAKEVVDMPESKLIGSIKRFLHDLLQNPATAQPNDGLQLNGFNRVKLLNILVDKGIVRRKQKIRDKDKDGNPVSAKMVVSYMVPKQNFDRNIKRLYIELFEVGDELNESFIGMTEATTAGSVSGGSFENFGFLQPIAPVQRRSFYNAEPKVKKKRRKRKKSKSQ